MNGQMGDLIGYSLLSLWIDPPRIFHWSKSQPSVVKTQMTISSSKSENMVYSCPGVNSYPSWRSFRI